MAITLHSLGVGPRHIMEGYEAARETCERAFEIYLQSRGPEHPYAVRMQSHLRDVLQKYEASSYLAA